MCYLSEYLLWDSDKKKRSGETAGSSAIRKVKGKPHKHTNKQTE